MKNILFLTLILLFSQKFIHSAERVLTQEQFQECIEYYRDRQSVMNMLENERPNIVGKSFDEIRKVINKLNPEPGQFYICVAHKLVL